MTKEQVEELRTWAYEPLTGEGHVHGLVLRLLDEREALLEALRDAANHGSGDEVEDRAREAIKKAEAP